MSSEAPEETRSAKVFLKKLLDDTSFSTNWLALQFEKDEIKVVDSGNGGYEQGLEVLKDEVIFLLIRGCHKRLKIIQKILVLILYIPENVTGFRRAKAAYQVDVLSKRMEIGHFCLVDTRKDSNLGIEQVTNRIKETIGAPGKYIIDETSNTVLREHFEDQERKKEQPQSDKKKQTESNVFKEILETEETYVRSLKLFVSSYITPLKIIVPDFYRSLFTLINIIININEEFLQKLQKTKGFSDSEGSKEKTKTDEDPDTSFDQWGEDNNVNKPEESKVDSDSPPKKEDEEEEESEGEKAEEKDLQHKKNVAMMLEIIVAQCPVFKLYLPYVNEYTKLLAKVNHLMLKDSKFKDFCNKKKLELQKKKERCTDIYGFLIMPIQRIPRYQLLMRDLLKQTHPMDPNYPKIKEGLDKTLELAQYVNTKKAEAVMSVKTISISQKFKMNDLMDLKRRMIKYSEDCTIQKKPGEICVFTDLLLLIPSGKKKVFRVSLADPDVRVYDSTTAAADLTSKKKSSHQIDDSAFVVETQRKKHMIGFKNKNNVEEFTQLIQTRLNVNLGQAAMDQKLAAHVIFKSFLQKNARKRYAANKRRWHELTADMKMKYYDKPYGKMKGGYSIIGATAGKGNATKGGKKKESEKDDHHDDKTGGVSSGDKYAFYIKTSKRTFQVQPSSVEILDTWIRILEMIGVKREDLIDAETEKQHQKELEQIFEQRDLKVELAELRERQAEEEARQEKLKEENYRKMFLKLNSMIRSMPAEEEGVGDSGEEEEDEGESGNETKVVDQKEKVTTAEKGKEEEKEESSAEKNPDDNVTKSDEPVIEVKSAPDDIKATDSKPPKAEEITAKDGGKEPSQAALKSIEGEKLPQQAKPAKGPSHKRPSRRNRLPPKPGQRRPPLPKRGRGRPGRPRGGGRPASLRSRTKPIMVKKKLRSPITPTSSVETNSEFVGAGKPKEEGEEEKTEEEERMEVLRRKNLIHTELRVRRKSVMRSQKLIEQIRMKKVAAPGTANGPGSTEKKEEDGSAEEKGEKISAEEEQLEAEKVIERKSDLHTELLMKKKKKNLFKKGWFRRKKKKNTPSSPTDDPTTTSAPESPPKEGKGKISLKKLPVFKGQKKKQGRPGPPIPVGKGSTSNVRPVTVSGSLVGKLKGLDGLKNSIKGVGGDSTEDDDDEKNQNKPAANSLPERPGVRRKKPPSEPEEKGLAVSAPAQVEKDFSQYSSEIQEILKKERAEWQNELMEKLKLEKERWMREELTSILEEKKKEWTEELENKIREEVKKEMNQK